MACGLQPFLTDHKICIHAITACRQRSLGEQSTFFARITRYVLFEEKLPVFQQKSSNRWRQIFQKVRGLIRSSRSAFPVSPIQYCKLNFRTWTLRCQLCMQHSSCNSCCTQGHYQWDILQCDTLWTGVQDEGTQ
jgi:hypothetical protein